MTDELSLVGKVIALHRAFDDAGVAHAFGGAIALAYYAEPRATKDIDVNVAVEPFETDRLLAALPAGVERIGDERENAERDGQLRLWWGATPLDLFLGFHEFHRQLAENARLVPFADTSIPVIDGADLVVHDRASPSIPRIASIRPHPILAPDRTPGRQRS